MWGVYAYEKCDECTRYCLHRANKIPTLLVHSFVVVFFVERNSSLKRCVRARAHMYILICPVSFMLKSGRSGMQETAVNSGLLLMAVMGLRFSH